METEEARSFVTASGGWCAPSETLYDMIQSGVLDQADARDVLNFNLSFDTAERTDPLREEIKVFGVKISVTSAQFERIRKLNETQLAEFANIIRSRRERV